MVYDCLVGERLQKKKGDILIISRIKEWLAAIPG
jgi:hypothetical protein